MTAGPPSAPPGYYPSPEGQGQRYWDGSRWAEAPSLAATHVRRGTTQASFNEENAGPLFFQIVVVAVLAGSLTSSWIAGGASLIGLLCLLWSRYGTALAVTLAAGWAVVGAFIGYVGVESIAAVTLAVVGGLVGLGVNLSGLEWARDITAGD